MRPTLKKWGFDGYGLVGVVYNHPNKPNGRDIYTSRLLSMRRDGKLLIAECKSREYILEDVAEDYEADYPNAIVRLLLRFEK